MKMEDSITEQEGIWKMDVDAFVPEPQGYIKIKDVEFPVYSFLDIGVLDSLKVTRIGEDIRKAETFDIRLARSVDQIIMLNGPAAKAGLPVLTKELFEGVSPHQILTMTMMVSSVARVPLKADGEKTTVEGTDSNSPSASPASADSSAGTTVVSSV